MVSASRSVARYLGHFGKQFVLGSQAWYQLNDTKQFIYTWNFCQITFLWSWKEQSFCLFSPLFSFEAECRAIEDNMGTLNERTYLYLASVIIRIWIHFCYDWLFMRDIHAQILQVKLTCLCLNPYLLFLDNSLWYIFFCLPFTLMGVLFFSSHSSFLLNFGDSNRKLTLEHRLDSRSGLFFSWFVKKF